MSERVIRVKGTGRASMPPDTIRVMMQLQGTKDTYEACMDQAVLTLEQLREVLKPFGFKKTDIKTNSFQVNTEYENIHGKDGNYKREWKGYTFQNQLHITFDSDSEFLGDILSAIAASPSQPEFSICYQLKDDEEIKSLLLKNAIKDAERKAEIIMDTAGVRLGQIQTIEYCFDAISPFQDGIHLRPAAMAMKAVRSIDLEPEELSVTDTVNIVWSIEDK